MKTIIVVLIFVCSLIGSTNLLAETKCIFNGSEIKCDEALSCKKIVGSIQASEKKDKLISKIISQKDFLILSENIIKGKECAIDIGFEFFKLALSNFEAEYLEELAIALSYSIESNAIIFLQYLPKEFIGHEEVLISLCCGVDEQFKEDTGYVRKRLNNRLNIIKKIKSPELLVAKDAIHTSIQNYLKVYHQ